MNNYFISRDLVSTLLNHSGLVITANNRIASTLNQALRDFSAADTGANPNELIIPQALSLEAWLEQNWTLLAASRTTTALLPQQELSLWQQIIEQDPSSLLLQPQATAALAQNAHASLSLWQQEIDRSFYGQPDTRKFAQWRASYIERCNADQLNDRVARIESILQGFIAGELASLPHIALLGFQTVPPLIQSCLTAATDELSPLSPPTIDAAVNKVALHDLDEELTTAAHWSKARLKTGHTRIGVIVPDLQQVRAQVRRTFAFVFNENPLAADRQSSSFNISASPRLSTCPMISAALNLLSLNHYKIEALDFYQLLRSVFLFDNAARFADAAGLEQYLRETQRPVLERSYLSKQIASYTEDNEDDVANNWKNALQAFNTLVAEESAVKSGKRLPSQWADLFGRQLLLFKWPGQRTLNSEEYQQHSKWSEALAEFAMFDTTLGEIDIFQCLRQLNTFFASIPFQPELKDAPIQILGKLEASALQFDCLWVAGMNDHVYPEPSAPNPLIPHSLQREHLMPHATAEQQLAFSQALFDSYRSAAKEVICSYSTHQEDQQLRPSYLLRKVNQIQTEDLFDSKIVTPLEDYLDRRNVNPVDWISDDYGAALNPQAETLTGGSAVLKDYASCPFKAFVRHRLNVRELKPPVSHLTQQQRGIILHRSLEFLWRGLRDSTRLSSLGEPRINELTRQAAEYALRRIAKERADILTPNRLALETKRLEMLLQTWLGVERQREPFKIYALEEAIEVDYAGLNLKLRIDRIDQFEDKSLAIIDYKSGAASLAQWQGERPDEPQLPLYLLNLQSNHSVSSLAFAQVSVDRMGWTGIAQNSPKIPGAEALEKARYWNLPRDWQALIEHWNETVVLLADGFASGDAQVTPKSTAACRYCDYASVCRIQELRINNAQQSGR